jgi:hypothetical protein
VCGDGGLCGSPVQGGGMGSPVQDDNYGSPVRSRRPVFGSPAVDGGTPGWLPFSPACGSGEVPLSPEQGGGAWGSPGAGCGGFVRCSPLNLVGLGPPPPLLASLCISALSEKKCTRRQPQEEEGSRGRGLPFLLTTGAGIARRTNIIGKS